METLQDVNRLTYDLTFSEDAYNELPYEQRLKLNLMTLLMTIVNRYDNIQKEVVSLGYERLLDNASGDMLDGVASRFFIEREEKDDNSLRGAIKIFALRQDSEGTRSEIYKLLQVIAGEGGYVKIYKGVNNRVEVCISVDCLDLSKIKVDIQNLFPVNTNVKFCSVPVMADAFGVASVFDANPPNKIGALGSVFDEYVFENCVATTIVDDERDL